MDRLIQPGVEAAMEDNALSYAEYQDQGYLPALDGLRGLAVALVITCHLHDKMWAPLSGYVGVIIFFVLSGYLITRLALKEENDRGRLSIGAFYIRRSFRIFPLYYTILALYAALILGLRVWPDKIVSFRGSLPYYLLYFQEVPFWKQMHLLAQPAPFYQSWSLGIEEKFYLVWPLLILAVPRCKTLARIWIAAGAIVVCFVVGIVSEGSTTYHLEDYGFILMGVLLALLLAQPSFYQKVVSRMRKVAVLSIVICLLTEFWLMPHIHIRGLSILYCCAATVLIGTLVTFVGTAKNILSSWLPVFVGRLSYGIYLVHILCLGVVEHMVKPGKGWLLGIIGYVCTLVLAVGVSYLLRITIELPLIDIGRRFSRRQLQQATHKFVDRRTIASTKKDISLIAD